MSSSLGWRISGREEKAEAAAMVKLGVFESSKSEWLSRRTDGCLERTVE
jgi:hypothetical protein